MGVGAGVRDGDRRDNRPCLGVREREPGLGLGLVSAEMLLHPDAPHPDEQESCPSFEPVLWECSLVLPQPWCGAGQAASLGQLGSERCLSRAGIGPRLSETFAVWLFICGPQSCMHWPSLPPQAYMPPSVNPLGPECPRTQWMKGEKEGGSLPISALVTATATCSKKMYLDTK